MNTTPPNPALRDQMEAICVRFSAIVNALLQVVCPLFANNPKPVVPERAIAMYLLRTKARFIALLARIAAGIAPRPESARKTPRVRLPQRKSWLASEIGWQGRSIASGIATLLNEPATAEIVVANPQAQRLLRPLCRMLGLAIPAIPRLLRKPRKPRKPKPKPRRLTRKQREAILWYPNSEGKPMKLLPRRLPRD